MKEITVKELHAMREGGEVFQLIDVREPEEIEIADMGGERIPMGEIVEQADRIRRDVKVVVHCRSGKRSASVVNQLEHAHGFNNLYNLKGGILAYSDEIDPSIPKY